MTRIDVTVESPVSTTVRARQVSSMFDAPPQKKARMQWQIDADIDGAPWHVGLIVGPSGSGKTTVMRHLWGEPSALEWSGTGVVDDFAKNLSVEQISGVCQAVGFNTIPAWMRPYAVLSNGEKFRVELARRLLEDGDPVVFDEFTSVVDRQVAQIGAHAVQKYCRKQGLRFVAVTCHYDVLDWLQPDWVLDMATHQFQRRLLQRRPAIECTIGRLPRAAWSVFAPYHYLTADLNNAATCYGLWANGRLAAFAAALFRPHDSRARIWGISRLVTLPDWQGMGFAMVLVDALGSEYRTAGERLRTYPAHPALVRTFDRSPNWRLVERPRMRSAHSYKSPTSTAQAAVKAGGRANAVFEYCGLAATEPRLLRAA